MDIYSGARDDVDERAADLVAETLCALARTRAAVALGVVGGRSVGGIYRRLAARDVPWAQVHVFLADERLVPITSDESNYKLVREDLLEALVASGRLPAGNAHPFAVDDSRPDAGVAAYGAELDRAGGRLDVVVLSAGEDGHCASLFPRHPALDDPSERFVLVEGSPKPPPRRVSASRRLLERAELGAIVFYGAGKADALAKFRDPAVDLRDCPSKVVQRMARGVLVTDLT